MIMGLMCGSNMSFQRLAHFFVRFSDSELNVSIRQITRQCIFAEQNMFDNFCQTWTEDNPTHFL